MAQKIELTDKGLTIIEIGDTIKSEEMPWLLPIKNYLHINEIRVGLFEKYQYHYINNDTLVIPQIGLVKDIFIASDSSNKVLSIFIFLDSTSERFTDTLNKIFKSTPLEASSGIVFESSTTIKHWMNDGITLQYRKTAKSKYSKLFIHKTVEEKNFSTVNFVE